jgi:hypothetical protein
LRLTAGAYITHDDNNAVGLVGETLIKVMVGEEIEKKIQQAVRDKTVTAKSMPDKIQQAIAAGVITAEENKLLEEIEMARREISAVDDFAPDEL